MYVSMEHFNGRTRQYRDFTMVQREVRVSYHQSILLLVNPIPVACCLYSFQHNIVGCLLSKFPKRLFPSGVISHAANY